MLSTLKFTLNDFHKDIIIGDNSQWVPGLLSAGVVGWGRGMSCSNCSLCLTSLWSTLFILLQEALRSSVQHLRMPPGPCPHVLSSTPALSGTQHQITNPQLPSDTGWSEEHGLGENARTAAGSPQGLANLWWLTLPLPNSSSHLATLAPCLDSVSFTHCSTVD